MGMKEKITIFEIEMDNLTAKETMIKAMEFLESESIDTIEIMSMDMLLSGREDKEWKEQVGEIKIVIPGEEEILTAADVRDRKKLREAEDRVFLKLFMKYLQKNRRRVYLLAETDDELRRVEDSVRRYNRGIRIAGHALLSPGSGREETVINDINGTETDCILSVLPSPYQEQFISRNKALLNARLWFGCGPALGKSYDDLHFLTKVKRFFLKKMFWYKVEKEQKEK